MPENPEEEGFTFVDRRRTSAPEPVAAPAPAPPPAPVAPIVLEREEQEFPGSELPPGDYTLPDVREMLMEYMLVLRDVSVLRLGLALNPATGKSEKDLPQAKIAIDTIAFLSTQIESALPPDERLPLKAMISDLQLNFVRLSGGTP
jgi:hypothetical protein